MKNEREQARKRLKKQIWFRQRLQMAPKFTDLVKYHAAEVNGNRVELPMKGVITMEEVNEAFFQGKTEVWDVTCFLIEKCLRHPALKGIQMEIEDADVLGLRSVYLTDQGREFEKK